jgi:hypothetical protein
MSVFLDAGHVLFLFTFFFSCLEGLFSLYITHGDISAKTLTGLSLFDVSTLFGLSLSVEQSVKGSLAGVVTELVDSPVKGSQKKTFLMVSISLPIHL